MNTSHPETDISTLGDIKLMDDRFSKSAFAVQATHFERHTLNEQFHEALGWLDGAAVLYTLGHLNDRPVNVVFNFEYIGGRMVLFWECVSSLCDKDLITAWLMENCPAFGKGNRTDATNFHKCVLFVTDGKGLFV